MVFNKLHNIFSQGNSKIRVCLYPALTPGPVQNLRATVDTRKPSVTLNWDPPANAKHPGDVTNYQIRFWDNDRDLSKLKCCNSVKLVKGSTTNIVITREPGLRPMTTFTFEVRARSGDSVCQEWKSVSTVVGMWYLVEHFKFNVICFEHTLMDVFFM